MCVGGVCVCFHMCAWVRGAQRKALSLLESDLLWFSEKSFNHRVISSATWILYSAPKPKSNLQANMLKQTYLLTKEAAVHWGDHKPAFTGLRLNHQTLTMHMHVLSFFSHEVKYRKDYHYHINTSTLELAPNRSDHLYSAPLSVSNVGLLFLWSANYT